MCGGRFREDLNFFGGIMQMSQTLWINKNIGDNLFDLLNLDHPDIQSIILSDIKADMDVYYDERWNMTEAFSHFIFENPKWVENKTVMILGAGIGLETLIIGRLAHKIYLNDMSLIALDLCAKQLIQNGVHNYEVIHGRYEDLELPKVDIIIGCFLVYNTESYKSMKQFVENSHCPILLMNEPFSAFKKLIRKADRKSNMLLSKDEYLCVLFE
jgi:predicted nicotinamide N-methyase